MKDDYIFVGIATVVVCVLIFIFGYRGSPSNPAPVTMTASQTATLVPFTKLVQGTRSNIPTRTNYVITSNEELTQLWNMIDATSTPPTVDFGKNVVLAVFAGKGLNAGITVAKVEDASARLVSVHIMTPSSTCTKKSIVSPYELVAVPKTALQVTHEDISSPVGCSK
ncbi:MAG: hypothetical protein ACHQU0_02220 [Candidatus Paceibacteria bacterium]